MVLARLEAAFEDFPAAIEAYSKATQIRPDRMDLHTARATLEERLMRFDQALTSYGKIYELAYHDPQWMEKIAELHARRGETDAAVAALSKAMIEGRPERPQNFFAVARRLESWNLLPQAKPFAEKGMDLAGNDLFAEPEYSSGAQSYARVMMRLREHEAAYARLHSAWQAAAAKAPPAEEGEEESGPSQATQRALSGYRSALEELGSTAGRYFTPEEEASFSAFLVKQRATATVDELSSALLPLTQHAGFADLEARWRLEVMLARPTHSSNYSHLARLVELQKRRLKFNDLGAQLQQYAAVVPNEQRSSILLQAAQSYRSAGNTAAELAILGRLGGSGGDLQRYLQLLLARNPQRLVQLAALPQPNATADAATNLAIASGNFPLALQAIQAHGRALPPVWTRGYTAITGFYYASPDPLVNAAFLAALGNATIGERVGKPVDRTQQLAGDVWFYYGSRYGEYLGTIHQGSPEDYLPAALEGAPARASAYTDLADYYRDARDPAHALEEYEHALELAPDRGDLHDRVALLLWDQGKHDAAAERWKTALQTFIRAQNAGRVEESFWTDVSRTLSHIGRRKLLPQMREPADRLLRDYIRRNGSYRVTPMLRAALSASADPAAGVAWIIDLANAAQSPDGFLGEIVNARWLPEAQRDLVFRRILELSEKRVAEAHGADLVNQQGALRNWQIQYLSYLVKTRQTERAQTLLAAIPPEPPAGTSPADSPAYSEEQSTPQAPDLAALEIRLAAQQNKLADLLARYLSQPEKMPALESLRAASLALRADGDAASARRVLEFLYTYELDQRNLDAANFLGLAEIRLETGDLPAALTLLRRMNLVAGQPFENLDASAALLEKTGHPAEAVEFRSARVQAVPWDLAARRALAEAQLSSAQTRDAGTQALAAVARSRDAAYDLRAAAALALGRAKAAIADLGSADLGFLSAGGALASIERPFFHYSRVEAAKSQKDAAARVRLLSAAIAIQPDSDSARLALFRAAADARRWSLAVAALTPLLDSSNDYRGQEAEAESDEGDGEPAAEPPVPTGFLARISMEPAARALLARTLAEAFQKLDSLPEAQTHFRTALALEPDAATRAQIRQRLAALRSELSRRVRDEQRRPRVSPNLEQQNLVRPRLLAKSAPAPPPAAPKGGTPR
jgi:Tfp pilus assembly protein PilF